MNDKIFNLQQAIDYIKDLQLNRKVTHIHIHHTAVPSHKDFNGSNHLQLVQNMRNYHVGVNGWSDIGQHFTLMPDGFLVTGRDMDKDPASILGWNTGAVCIEMLGNFNVGKDSFQGTQAESAYRFVGALLKKFNLPIDAVKFHRDNPNAGNYECPGTAIDKNYFLAEVELRYSIMFPSEPEPAPSDSDQWKLDGIKALYDAGLLIDYEAWAARKEDSAPVYLVTTVLARMYKKLKG